MGDTSGHASLVRAIGRWTLAALVINAIIGSGIFGLPGEIARHLGAAAPLAYLLAAAGIGVIMACFAEVASQFVASGGPYLYTREAFGRFAGIQVGWFAWLVRLTSAAANANLFVIYLGNFWPLMQKPDSWTLPPNLWWPRAAVLSAIFGLLAFVNVRGVKAGARTSNFFTAAKLVPLSAFIVAGLLLARGHWPETGEASAESWVAALLALVFAFGGFESALMPMAEAKNPRRDAPFALFTAIAVCAAFYTLIHVVVMLALADPSATERPLAEAARAFLGDWGAALISLAALVSTSGYLAGQFVSAPRLTFAFAENRDFPALFGAVHPRFRTPFISIIVYAFLALGLALYGNFIWNAILSAVARLFTYGLVCGALLRLRRMQPQADAFRLPAGMLAAWLGIAFCAVLMAQMNRQHLLIVCVVGFAASVNWLMARMKS
jgi:amino acid transporter